MDRLTWDWLLKNWGKVCLFTAVFLTIPLLAFCQRIDLLLLFIWLQTPLYMLHQFEEHGAGGFKRFVNTQVFKAGDREVLTDRKIFWINIPIIWVLFPLFSILSAINPVLGLWIPVFSVFNALSHIIMTVVKRKIAPGFFVSLFLNIPAGAFTIYLFYVQGLVNTLAILLSIAVTIVLHVIVLAVMRKK